MSYKQSRKRSLRECLDNNSGMEEYKFRILLPNGEITDLILRHSGDEMFVDEFVDSVRREFEKSAKRSAGAKRNILWDGDIYLEDMSENKIKKRIIFNRFKTNKLHLLRLHDGAEETVNTFQNMWDLTPDTDLLSELPAEYTFVAALADLIDNSLQAIWSNGVSVRRLVRVTVDEHVISIFDTGPGMDGSEEKSIVKWGKFGSSNHRSSRGLAIGVKPPYLMPLFGMFGYGGSIASMQLGRCALVSSKTKESKKVYTLYLEREALLNGYGSESNWRTDGGIRHPSEDEIQLSPHGSFTKVEIRDLKIKCLETSQLQCRLKDIYFPYIQCDDVRSNGKTTMPIQFQVNGVNLAEIEGGEVAVTNWYSSNGPEFVLQLRFVKENSDSSTSPGTRKVHEANARLKCVYFPIVEGKESIDRILEKLKDEGCGIMETFKTFSRVSIRRLGRLLPDARWGKLPFMEPRQKKGDKAEILKRCCWRVKCFVETDAGFSPTPSKTDLAHHDAFTNALRSIGNNSSVEKSEPTVKIYKGEVPLSFSKLEKEYQDWVFQMHEKYDEEIDCGEDQPVLVVSPRNKKGLGISSEVVRVHRVIRRKDASWKSGQKVKILKGAVGCPKNNLYGTIEYILLEGFQGDSGGEARLICRPLGCPVEKGCLLEVNGETANLDIRGSSSFPISVIDSGKCQAIDSATWKYQLEKRRQKGPSAIEILNIDHCRQLEIDGALSFCSQVSAGFMPPKEIVAVVRPVDFTTSSSSKGLDQKHIIKDDLEMSMEIKYIGEDKDTQGHLPICAERIKPSSRKGFGGLYIFPLGTKWPKLFHKAGVYKFCFSICTNSGRLLLESEVVVRPSSYSGKWGVLCDRKGPFTNGKSVMVRVGSCVPHLSIACYDEFYNRRPFRCIPHVNIKIKTGRTLFHVDKMVMKLSSGKRILEIMDMLIESRELDSIRPHYNATMEISSQDELFSATVPCQVIPGNIDHVTMKQSPELENGLLPGSAVKELILELFDAYGNHVAKGLEVCIDVDGFHFQDHICSRHKVDDHGYVNLSGLLKVTGGYGTHAHLSVHFDGKIFFKKEFQVVKRELRIASRMPNNCVAGSQLENIVFEVTDSKGTIDEGIHDDAIHGQFHTLSITSESSGIDDTVRYTFRHGRCIVPVIPVPLEDGTFHVMAYHSLHSELHISVEVSIMRAPKLELVTLTQPYADVTQCYSSDNRALLLPSESVHGPSHMHAIVESIIDDEKELEKALREVGFQIGIHEKQLKILKDQRTAIWQEINNLQGPEIASMDPISLRQIYNLINMKEEIVKRSEVKGDNVAAVFCNLLMDIQLQESQKHFMQDVLGLVALLGSVDNNRLSRIFAEYLGEDYMLAVVVKSYKTARTLEKYSKNGEVDCNHALHEAAAAMGKTINGRFLVICLEEIRPYGGFSEGNDPQKKLALPDPLLPSGEVPPGFIGYAVNMINLDMACGIHTITSAGHGLRETLFYLLFGELQVYKTREDMQQANLCINSGAISLDGGIMKGNGVIALGDWEPEVRFPVEPHRPLPQHTIDAMKKIQEKKAKFDALNVQIEEESKAHTKAMHKFSKRKDQLYKYMALVKRVTGITEIGN